MKTLIEKILDNAFYGYIVSVLIIFSITIFTTPFVTAIIGSLFFGIFALPITGFVLSLIDSLLPPKTL